MRTVLHSSVLVLIIAAGSAAAQAQSQGRETYTGTLVSFPSGFQTRTITTTFTLIIDRRTSQQRIQNLLGVLQEGNRNRLVDAVNDETVGSFSVAGRIGPRVNVVHESMVNGQRRIFAVFERWREFAELRGGYRSLDYPFGVIELHIDPQTGRGEGTYIAAAQIEWETDNGVNQIEIENFATFPNKLMGVQMRGRR